MIAVDKTGAMPLQPHNPTCHARYNAGRCRSRPAQPARSPEWVMRRVQHEPYWVGYRIAKTYYLRARGRKAALREIIRIDDPKAFLAKSGWTPGMRLPGAT